MIWDIRGRPRLKGKMAFGREINNEDFEGPPKLDLLQLIEEGDTVVAPHRGKVRCRGGETMNFAACDIFHFSKDKIARVESYVVPLAEAQQPTDNRSQTVN